MEKKLHRKPLFWTNLITLTVFGLTIAGVIFAWTNPPSNPPNPPGAVTASNSNVGIGTSNLTVGARVTINGILDMLTNRITSVATPQAGSDAATMDYVDALTGSAGRAAVVLFGQANQSGSNPSAGAGVPLCSTLGSNNDWIEAYAGYGPHWIGVDQIYETDNLGNGSTITIVGDSSVTENLPGPLAFPDHFIARTAYASDSTCSPYATSVIPMIVTANSGITATNPIALARACGEVMMNTTGNGSGLFFCNTCRVCIKP